MGLKYPDFYHDIQLKTDEIGFNMPSDSELGAFLRSLVASKPNGSYLELGTGTGLSLAWLVDGLGKGGQVVSVDNDEEVQGVARAFFDNDPRVFFECIDGSVWIRTHPESSFDLIFADAWPGKYSDLEETLDMVKPGGIYLVDDMLPQSNWPEGHEEKANDLTERLKNLEDFHTSFFHWSTGVIMAVRKG